MTLIIELPPELESRLAKHAEHTGTDPAEYVRRLLDTNLPAKPPPSKRKLSGYGKFRHIPLDSEDVHRERLQDLSSDERSFLPKEQSPAK